MWRWLSKFYWEIKREWDRLEYQGKVGKYEVYIYENGMVKIEDSTSVRVYNLVNAEVKSESDEIIVKGLIKIFPRFDETLEDTVERITIKIDKEGISEKIG